MSNKTERLGNHATKRERAEAHRIKMEMKVHMREHNRTRVLDNQPWVLANLSQYHEDYGLSPLQHESKKVLDSEPQK